MLPQVRARPLLRCASKLDTTRKSRAWSVESGGSTGRRAEIAIFLSVKALERPANSAHLAPGPASASPLPGALALAEALEVVAQKEKKP